jgi:hypothetical protein
VVRTSRCCRGLLTEDGGRRLDTSRKHPGKRRVTRRSGHLEFRLDRDLRVERWC